MRDRLRKSARRFPPGASGSPCACGTERRAQEASQPLRFPYEAPVVIDHGPLADLTWARFSGLARKLRRPCDDA
jgi:hypothetical protein